MGEVAIPSTLGSLLLLLLLVMVARLSEGSVVVFQAGEGGYFCFKIPTLIAVDSAVIALAEARSQNCSDYAQTALVAKISHDGGASFGGLAVVYAEPFSVIGNAAPIVLPTGRILLPFCRNNLQVLLTYSDDAGGSWSAPRLLSNVTLPTWKWIGIGPPVGLRLRSGRLLLPAYHDTHAHWSDGTLTHVHLLLSDDEGATWRIGANLGDGQSLGDDFSNECVAVELASGEVLINARTLGRFRVQLRSGDGGESFAGRPQPVPQQLSPIDGCEASMLVLPNGTLWLVTPNTPTLRFNLTLFSSDDAGGSWSARSVLRHDPAGYSAMALLGGGRVGLLYETAEPPPTLLFQPDKIVFDVL